MPGSPLDPRSRGANDLLRNGATLTETAADILAAARAAAAPGHRWRDTSYRDSSALPLSRGRLGRTRPAAPSGSASDRRALDLIVEKLSPTPVAVDELVRQCQLSAASVATLLLELELAGRVERHPGNLVSLR